MTPRPTSSAPDEQMSGALLRALRVQAGLSQTEASKRSGVSQAQLSRMETGGSPLRHRWINSLLRAYSDASGSSLPAERVARLLTQVHPDTEQLDTRVVLQQGTAHNFQLRVRDAEAGAAVVRSYQPTMPLGVLQTPEFMDATFTANLGFTADDAEASTRVRTSRAAKLAEEPDRGWYLIQTEQSLRWPVRSYAIQAAQVEWMAEVSRLPNVHFGVVALDTVAPEPAPLTGFHLYDDQQVLVETELGLTLVSAPEQVAPFVRAHAMLTGLAVWDDDARTILDRIARDYRRRTS